MNLSEKQTAKQIAQNAYLTEKVNQTLEHYQTADISQRIATIRQIDGFPLNSQAEKTFWHRVRYQLERMNEKDSSLLPSKSETIFRAVITGLQKQIRNKSEVAQ